MEQTSGACGVARLALSATYAIPGYLLGIYALLMLALGWFAHQRWVEKTPVITAAHAAPAPVVVDAVPQLPVLAITSSTPSASTEQNVPPTAEPADKPQQTPLRAIDGQLPALRYSAHVFTSEPVQRSITLNGVRYQEGESPMEGVIIEQIQQEVTLFAVNGEVFILDALADWPGGDIKEAQ